MSKKTLSPSMAKDNLVYIKHILDSIEHGEAANHIDKSYLETHPNIPWQNIIGMRHKLIHDYFDIRMDLVWETVIQDLPSLKPQLISLLENTNQ